MNQEEDYYEIPKGSFAETYDKMEDDFEDSLVEATE